MKTAEERLLEYGFEPLEDGSESEFILERQDKLPILLMFKKDFSEFSILESDINYGRTYFTTITIGLTKIIYEYMLSKQPKTEDDLKNHMVEQFLLRRRIKCLEKARELKN